MMKFNFQIKILIVASIFVSSVSNGLMVQAQTNRPARENTCEQRNCSPNDTKTRESNQNQQQNNSQNDSQTNEKKSSETKTVEEEFERAQPPVHVTGSN